MDAAETHRPVGNSPPDTARARSVLVIEGLPELMPLLRQKNFLVFELTQDATEDEIGQLLAHRVLVTRTPDLWREQAAIEEFSIIDVGDHHDLPALATELSRLWTELRLKLRQSFVLRLRREADFSFEDIE